MSKISDKQTKYDLIVKSLDDYFKLGTILIKRQEGDIYYIPSQRYISGSSFNVKEKQLDKISFHKSGKVHIKSRNNDYFSEDFRFPIKEIGFQELVKDTTTDFEKLPKFTKNIDDLDVVFDIDNYKGSIEFIFSIISGKLFIDKLEGKKCGIKDISEERKSLILSSQIRCLGCESGNADKMLSYVLYKYTGDKKFPTNREVFIPNDFKISKNIK